MTCKGELQNPFVSLSLQMAILMEKVKYLIRALFLGAVSSDLLCDQLGIFKYIKAIVMKSGILSVFFTLN